MIKLLVFHALGKMNVTCNEFIGSMGTQGSKDKGSSDTEKLVEDKEVET
jgi:hypothetical protein